MKHNNGRRSRGRSYKKGPSRMQVFDSNGPEVRIRGTAHQVTEKYLALAKDAASAGDHTLQQNYLQHAEHYQRVINSFDRDNNIQKETKPAAKEETQADFGLTEQQETKVEKVEVKAKEKELEPA